MALIGQIRKNMWFVFILLGLALVAFMMMDSSMGGKGGPSGSTAMTINGNKVDVNQFSRIESIESSTSGLTGNALRSKVFDDLLTRTIVEDEADALGLGVPEEEMNGLLFGMNPSPIIQQWFRNPQTGQVDFQQLQNVKSTLESGDVNPGFLPLWEEKSKQVKARKIQDKIASMVSKGIYTPSWMASELAKTTNVNATFDYVQVPMNLVEAQEVELTDADYKSYLDENKNLFNNKEEGRVVEYVVFDIEPTVADSVSVKEAVAKKIEKYRTTKNDSLYAITNGGNYQNYYFKSEDLPEAFQEEVDSLEVGDLMGPKLNNRYYSVIKILDKKMVPDSIEASHILRTATPGVPETFETAMAYIDSLKTLLDAGTVQFDSLAIKNSQDPGSAAQGGELGYFTQGAMVPSFNEAVFITGQKEGYYTVKTKFGVHLIKVTDVIFSDEEPKYKVSFINSPIIPSVNTLNEITNSASEFIVNNRSLENMRASAATNPNINIRTSSILNRKDYEFEDFGYADDSRKIIIWAFNSNTSVGDVSADLFSFRDPTFNYESQFIIPALQAEIPKGTSRLADIKNSITEQVLAYKKANMMSESMKGKSLEAIAESQGLEVKTVDNMLLSGSVITGIGYEPKVVAAVVNGTAGSMTEPIVGSNGVYMLKINNLQQSGTTGNVSYLKKNSTDQARRNAATQLINAMKENAEVKDKRMEFNM